MINIQRLVLENYGPFKNEQEIVFPEQGVAIVYGANMRGKTSLLNAIRYAFFGKILRHGARTLERHLIANWESTQEGKYGFRVTLEFKADGQQYELTRQCAVRVEPPQGPDDYIEKVHMRRDGEVLSSLDMDSELEKLMPEDVSRFFLFDGELLQQYEELLRNESEMGTQIAAAIERILGVPILQHARGDMAEILKRARSQETRLAAKNKKTQELASNLSNLGVKRSGVEESIKKYNTTLAEETSKKRSLEDQLRRDARIRGLFEQKDAVEGQLIALKSDIVRKTADLKDRMRFTWRDLLAQQADLIRDRCHEEIKGLIESGQSVAVARQISELQEKSEKDGACQLCGQKIDGKIHRPEVAPEVVGKDVRALMMALSGRVERLSKFKNLGALGAAAELRSSIDEARIRVIGLNDQLEEYAEKTRGYDHTEIRKINAEYESCIRTIAEVANTLARLKVELNEIDSRIGAIEDELKRHAGADLQKIQQKIELCDSLGKLFVAAVEIFRGRLRERVQADATRLFLLLTTEKDYAGLQINESYGLSIVHRDGRAIPVRSAGAEHVVALSLMGALQRNAPLRGPIIMDTPFGRLDEQHTRKVVAALPKMADQVVVFVHEQELRPAIARETLAGDLKTEYKLERISARHTSIVRL